MYASYEDYQSAHDALPDMVEAERWLEQASTGVDSLTFNRITAIGFANLTEFQQNIVREVTCQLAEFTVQNADVLESVLSGYSINGVSAQFGENMGILVQGGVAIPRRLYSWLCQTGLCSRRLR